MNNGQTYEMGYLALSNLSPSELENLQTTLADVVASSGGQVISHSDVHFIDLEYTMFKKAGSKNIRHNQAHFAWMKFNAPTDVINTIDTQAKSHADIVRFLITKTLSNDSATDVFTLIEEEDGQEETSEDTDTVSTSLDNDTQETNTVAAVASDDLTMIEGIGPVLASTLTQGGIGTFTALADADVDTINALIASVRGNHDPNTWATQATLARDGRWDDLKELQAQLNGGVA